MPVPPGTAGESILLQNEVQFRSAVEDIRPERAFIVTAGTGRYPLAEGIEAVDLREMASVLGEP